MNYILHLLIMINIYLILGFSANLIVGMAGLLTVAHAAFYGLGAYAYTLIVMKLGFGFFPALFLTVLTVFLISYCLSWPMIKLKKDSFIIGSFGLQIIIFTLLYNWVDLTRGPYGIPGIPKPVIFGSQISSLLPYWIFSSVIVLFVTILTYFLYNSRFCKVLEGIRENELSVSTLGRNVISFKQKAFVIGSTLAAISGMLFATYVTYIDPTSFTIDESIFILSIIIIGGAGNMKGVVAGTLFMILLPELLRFIGIPDSFAANLRQIIYGLALIGVMKYRPQGLLGKYKLK